MKRLFAILLALSLLVSCSQTVPNSSDDRTESGEKAYVIGGIPLEDFAMAGKGEEYTTLKTIVFELCGKLPKSESENVIRFEISKDVDPFSVRAVFDGDDLVVQISGEGITAKDSAQIVYEIFSSKNNEKAEFDMVQNIMPQGYSVATSEYISQLRNQTDQRIQEIKNTPNMKIPENATVYYVSNSGNDLNDGKSPEKAIKTVERVNSLNLTGGEYVLFERGGLYRGEVLACPNVTYSAYGVGEKPIVTPSPENGADKTKWVKVAKNVWEFETEFEKDVGVIVFNDGEQHAVLWLPLPDENGNIREYVNGKPWTGPESIDEDLGYWYNSANKKVYLCSEQNPGERFDSIEFGVNKFSFKLQNGANILIDNISIKYAGHGGISGASMVENFVTQNCEFYWIGGGMHYVDYSVTPARPVRWGNGVGIFGQCDGFIVDNCYFAQNYDAAISPQYNFSETDPDDLVIKLNNSVFTNNVIEYCNYSIEYFLGRMKSGNQSIMENLLIENNLMWYAGEGFCEQRPDKNQAAHIKSWGHVNPAKNIVIKNNVMGYSTDMLVHIHADQKESMPFSENNVYIGVYNQEFGVYSQMNNSRVSYDLTTKDYYSEFSKDEKFYFTKE